MEQAVDTLPIPWPTGWDREMFAGAIFEAAGAKCAVQHDGWPCGSCFMANFPNDLDLPVDPWHLVCAVRGDYLEDWQPDGSFRAAYSLVFNEDGTFKEHLFKTYPRSYMIAALAKVTRFLDGRLDAKLTSGG